ncbi:hypothetical protein [Ureaplasma diversum]|nr:hypothetical protein [Ureaplasma diversum]
MRKQKRLLIATLISSLVVLTPIILASCNNQANRWKDQATKQKNTNSIKRLDDLFDQSSTNPKANSSDQENEPLKINFDKIKFNKIDLDQNQPTPKLESTKPNPPKNQLELDPNKTVEVIQNQDNDPNFGKLRFSIKTKATNQEELKKEAAKLFSTTLKNHLDGLYYQLDEDNHEIVLYVKDLLTVNNYKQLLTLYFNKSQLVEKITLFLTDQVVKPNNNQNKLIKQSDQLDPNKTINIIENKNNDESLGVLRFVIRFDLDDNESLQKQALAMFKVGFKDHVNDIAYALNPTLNEVIIYPKDHSKLETYKKILTQYFNYEPKVKAITLYLSEQVVDYKKYQKNQKEQNEVKYKYQAYTYTNQINQPVYVLQKISNQLTNSQTKQNLTSDHFILINDWNTFEQQEFAINNSKYIDLVKTNLMQTVDFSKQSILVINGINDKLPENDNNSNHLSGWNLEAAKINLAKKQIDLYLNNNESYSLFESIFNKRSKKYKATKVFFVVVNKIDNPKDFSIVINHNQSF